MPNIENKAANYPAIIFDATKHRYQHWQKSTWS